MSTANPEDVATSLLRPLTSQEAASVDELLGRAEALLKARIPDLERKLQTASYKTLVVGVEAEAVARVFRNPEGFRSENEGNYGYSLDYTVASGRLTIQDDEWLLLGVSPFGTLAPKTDGYAQQRFLQARPDLLFQYAWPAPRVDLAETIEDSS